MFEDASLNIIAINVIVFNYVYGVTTGSGKLSLSLSGEFSGEESSRTGE